MANVAAFLERLKAAGMQLYSPEEIRGMANEEAH